MILKKIPYFLIFLVLTLNGLAGESSPSFGPNGTHWPSLVPTPFMYDESVPIKIEVDPDWDEISDAIESLTDDQVNIGVLIQVRPGTLEGNGIGTTAEAVLENIGSASWTKRVTICPKDGYGTVHLNRTKIQYLKNICLAGFTADGGLHFRGCESCALAWIQFETGYLGTFGDEDIVSDKIEFVEIVVQNQRRSNADTAQVAASGGTIRNWVFEGCHYAPVNIPLPKVGNPHSDTLQFFNNGDGVYEDITFKDCAIFASDNTAIQTGLVDGMTLDHTLLVSGETVYEYYPEPFDGENDSTKTLNGSGRNFEVIDSIIIGFMGLNNDAGSNQIFTKVENSQVSYQPSGISSPAQGSWTVNNNLTSESIEGYPPFPTDSYLLSIWSKELFINDPTPDEEAPSTPQSLVATPLSLSSIQLDWQASSDNQRVSGYQIYQDGVFLRNVTGFTVIIDNLSPATPYSFTVVAFDASGNESDPSLEVSSTTLERTNPNDFLLAHWPLDEISGNSVTDVIGNRVGNFSGTPELGDGVVSIDSDEDRIDVNTFDVVGNQITLSCWVNLDSVEGFAKEARFISKASSTASDDHYWMLGNINDGTAIRFRLKVDGVTSTLISNEGVISVGQRHHLVATFDGTTMRIYVDGTLVASQVNSGTISSGNVTIGLGNQPSGAGNRGMRGDLDDVRIYSYAVLAEDIPLISVSTDNNGYISWLEDNGLSTDLSPSSDDDHDGLPLLLEYAFGSDPLSFSQNPLSIEENEGQKTVTFPKLRPELNYLIETSENLTDWGTDWVSQETGNLSADLNKLFIRVKVTQ